MASKRIIRSGLHGIVEATVSAMRIRLFIVALTLLAFAGSSWARAQSFDATDLHRVTDIGDGKWLVRAGDDPSWSRADLDDSGWQTVSTEDDLRSAIGQTKPAVVWYRLHMRVSPADRNLAISQNNLASAFEVYTNGVLIMRAGSVSPYRGVTSVYTQAAIPRSQVATGVVVVALRLGFSSGEWLNNRPGLAPSNILLGYGLQLEDRRHYRVLVDATAQWFNGVLGLFVGLIALGIFLVNRERHEYLWAFFYGFTSALYLGLSLVRNVYPLPLFWYDVLTGVLGALPGISAIRFVWSTLGHKAGWWIRSFQYLLLTVPALLYIGSDQGRVSFRVLVFALLPFSLATALVLPVFVIRDGRRGNREAWLLLIPLVLVSFETYLQFTGYILSAFSMKSDRLDAITGALNNMSLGSLTLSLDTATSTVALSSIALIIVLRANRVSRQLSHAAAELEAARGVQSLLLSRESIPTPGFAVESVYQPAQEVGGDFFLVSPGADGSLMVVIGDVSGKGLPAALRVSLILGALQREPSRRPAQVLCGLNKVLCGQSDGGFTTCGCAVIAVDGTLTLANAGHLSPYRNGEEVAVQGGLPLGIVSEAEYDETAHQLASGDSLRFISDGVVEARDGKGDLLGFDRVLEMSRNSAAEIASAAQAFGQDDDITVVSIIWIGVHAIAPARVTDQAMI
ncbi:MAG TPA: SpoIIE family protein phosphatase [Acidisarcina sp.]